MQAHSYVRHASINQTYETLAVRFSALSILLNMSISSNNSSIPVNQHPLSPDELPSSGKPPRRRPRRRDDKPQPSPRPATSYFSLKKPISHQDVSSNSNDHDPYSSNHTRRATADWDGSVRGFSKRKQKNRVSSKDDSRGQGSPSTSIRTSTLSLVWDRPSVPLFIVGSSKSALSSEKTLTTPPGTPLQQPILTLSPSGPEKSLHGLPARAASHILSTPYHSLSDTDIQNAISDLSVLSEQDHVRCVPFCTRICAMRLSGVFPASRTLITRHYGFCLRRWIS